MRASAGALSWPKNQIQYRVFQKYSLFESATIGGILQLFWQERATAAPPFHICRFDRGLLCTHVRCETADASLAEPAFIFPVSHWNDMNIVIVESPAKAQTIHKYLGASYEVVGAFGQA